MEKIIDKIKRNVVYIRSHRVCNKNHIKHGKRNDIKRINVLNGQYIEILNDVQFYGFVTLKCIKKFYGKTYSPNIIIGNNVFINNGVVIESVESVIIGEGTHIGCDVLIIDYDHISIPERSLLRGIVSKTIIIGNNVWIGAKSVVLKGVTLGNNSIVGAGSIVTKDVPPNTMVVGNPAIPIKQYDFSLKEWVKI